uniref:Uncharacterized protein n=1 Tax=Anguilla anguilla TaxID=7936 RepID=A0A0E9UU12_ANGAN
MLTQYLCSDFSVGTYNWLFFIPP